MAKSDEHGRRRNRTLAVGEAVGAILDPALKKRGFASRDLIAQWRDIVPPPYNAVSAPDRLAWPRGPAAAEGATLYVRCLPAHVLALSHEAPAISAAINRYFGYVLVGSVRLSIEPLAGPPPAQEAAPPPPDEGMRARVAEALDGVKDEGLREALRQLGHGLLTRRRD